MSQGYFFVPGAGSGNSVLVVNSHAASQDVPVQVFNPPGSPGNETLVGPSGQPATNSAWNGGLATALSAVDVQSAGSIVNRAVEQKASGAGDLTLARPASCSNFLSVVIYNPTTTDCTVTLGTSGGGTITVQANSSVPFDCDCSKLVLHATAANQQIIGMVYDPAVT